MVNQDEDFGRRKTNKNKCDHCHGLVVFRKGVKFLSHQGVRENGFVLKPLDHIKA